MIVEELLDRVIDHVEREVPWRPGAVELLADLNRSGVPCALVTMSYRRFVAPILAALPADAFATVVTGDAVSQGKPHPEPYLKAARNLGVPRPTAWRSRTPTRAPGPPWPPGAPCWWCPTTCRCCRGSAASSATRSPTWRLAISPTLA